MAVGRAIARRFGPYTAYLLPVVVGGAIFSAGVWAFGEVYEGVQERGDVAVLDRPALAFAMSLRSPPLNAVVTAFTDLGGTVIAPIWSTIAVIALAVVRRSWTPALVVVPAALGSILMTSVGKRIVGRVRPPFADAVPPFELSPSFPSGHSLNAVVVAGAIAYVLLLRRRTAAGRTVVVLAAVVYAIAMGLSRVYLGLHWLTDVLAAWGIGVAWLALVITAHRVLLTLRRSRADPVPTG